MPAYLIARVEVTDWPRYREYTKATPGAVARHGGRFIVPALSTNRNSFSCVAARCIIST